ncbi:radiation-inducible immediate-early gene IEX-1 [Oxyura jamaicensis]|uniref:radiation-inducible immediate-early gene IEX-1 n=1 Tax=Oxyura jamaicensis TaxID=8884 RepID=UPI0015A71603|nr:radiation-inducible immediate-early gene IEX-1 [Oxyura jamaicensis]
MTAARAPAATVAPFPSGAWGGPGGLAPSPPRYFTFEPPAGPSGAPRPRRRHRRVLYPPAVRRPPPTEEPSAAKRLLVLLLAVVGAQVYSAPGDAAPVVAPEAAVTPPLTPDVALNTPLGPQEPPRTMVTTRPPNGTLVRTPAGAPMGASCPRLLLLSPALHPHNGTAEGAAPRDPHLLSG